MTLCGWAALGRDPLPGLLDVQEPALVWFVRRDLLGERVPAVESLWELPEARVLASRQQAGGSWRYPGKSYDPVSNTNYDLLETFRVLRLLVEMYAFDRRNPVLRRAAEYLYSCQTDEGDIRGILGNQYMPYYHAAILELLIKAGYADDPRSTHGLQWLLSMRQEDGGWVIPAQQLPARLKTGALWHGPPVLPERARPHAHIATGMVLRAFAAQPAYRQLPEVVRAGERLKERLFQADRYNDRKASAYWLKFQFPFWWPSLVSALDSLSQLGFSRHDVQIARGLDWFACNQAADGLWGTGYGSGRRAEEMRRWVALSVCRVLKRFSEQG